MPAKNDTAADVAGREIIMSRLLSAPRELVFKAFTDPKHIVHWWGPNGFTNTIHEMHVKPGGVFRFMMHGPDGTDWPNRISYLEVVEPERLVYLVDDDSDNKAEEFHVTVTFEEQGRQTLLTMRTLFATAAECARVKQFGAVEGGQQTLDRLTAYLLKMAG